MKLISSYPRSGSARLKFILCYLLYPSFDGSFKEMSKLIPSIDNPLTRAEGIGTKFLCTHSHIDSDIYLYRHVGDCLISEYWFKQKFYPNDQTLEDYIISTNYGEQWRKSVEQGRSSPIKISFQDLNYPIALSGLSLVNKPFIAYIEAIEKSNFDSMRDSETNEDLYYMPDGNNDIPYMRKGTSGQWKGLSIADEICQMNEGELKYLKLMKYESETGKYVDYN